MESLIRSGAVRLNKEDIREYIDRTAANMVQCLVRRKMSLSAAESCTGGLLCSAITAVPGASKVFGCGVVSYSEEIKQKLLGVPERTISDFGVVSAETAIAMAEGVKKLSGSDISVGITGLAGPKGEDDVLPVGTVYISVIFKDSAAAENLKLYELGEFDREMNRLLSVALTLEKAYSTLESL